MYIGYADGFSGWIPIFLPWLPALDIAHRLEMVRIMIQRLQCNVFMLSYRGYVFYLNVASASIPFNIFQQQICSLIYIYCCYFNGMITVAIWPQAVMEQVMVILLSMELLEMLRCALVLFIYLVQHRFNATSSIAQERWPTMLW